MWPSAMVTISHVCVLLFSHGHLHVQVQVHVHVPPFIITLNVLLQHGTMQ